MLECVLEVERSDETVLGCRDRQIHDACIALRLGQLTLLAASTALGAPQAGISRITGEPASLDDLNRGQYRSKRANRRGLRSPLLSTNQDAANAGVDRIQQQRQLQD